MTLDDAMSDDKLIKDLRLSFSKISDFDRNGPQSLIKRTTIEGEFLDFGSLVDDMLQPDFNINDNYYIFDGEKPTAMLGVLCDHLVNIINENVYQFCSIKEEDLIISSIKELGLWKTIKDNDKLLNKFTPEAKAYVIAKTAKGDKTLVSNLLVQEAEEMVALLKTHDNTKDFFKKDLLYQKNIIYKIDDFNILSILDYINIDHDAMTIQGIDLKTGSKPIKEFKSNFIKFRYYLQAELYQQALEKFKKDNNLENYTILPFKFLYCSRYEKIPVFIKISDKWAVAAQKGFTTKSGYKYKGIYELIGDIKWHWLNNIFDQSKETYENNGLITIKDNFIDLI